MANRQIAVTDSGKGLKLTAVQMAPDPFCGMVMKRSLLPAFGARPLHTPGMLAPDIDPLGGNIKVHPTDEPRVRQTQKMTVKIGITATECGMGCCASRYPGSLRFATRSYQTGVTICWEPNLTR